jgi:hypothetical protein
VMRVQTGDLKWKTNLSAFQTAKSYEKLLNGELVNQVNNNCGVSKITNAIAHIRKFVGYENIVNVRIDGLRCDCYELVRTPKTIARMVELKELIKARIKRPVKGNR